MPSIDALAYRRVLNSHAAFTTEFEVRLTDGAIGLGASSEGETISVFEDNSTADPAGVVIRMREDGVLGRDLDQESFDAYLESKMGSFGRNLCYALSLAFHEALSSTASPGVREGVRPPLICFNILNGGRHAYTNPILSDFPEYLLVARSHDVDDMLAKHDEVLRAVQAGLSTLPRETASGNSVAAFGVRDNRACIEFLLGVCEDRGVANDFQLMIDASGGDLWDGATYRLALTNASTYTQDEFCEYWLDLVAQYPLRFLEDPFAEGDSDSWKRVAGQQRACRLIGDNLYSTSARRIAEGAAAGLTHGAIIKPNQAGTMTAVMKAVEAARGAGQFMVASHRSISTESTYIAQLACRAGLEYIKVGPLQTDYSAVMRVNEIIRMTT